MDTFQKDPRAQAFIEREKQYKQRIIEGDVLIQKDDKLQVDIPKTVYEYLLDKILDYNTLISPIIDSENWFYEKGVYEMEKFTFESVEEGVLRKYRLKVTNWQFPSITPQDARNVGETYMAILNMVVIDVTEGVDNPIDTGVGVKFEIPVAIGSVLDPVYRRARESMSTTTTDSSLLSPVEREKVNVGECPLDVEGYFIIGGTEKFLVTQERLMNNFPFTRIVAKDGGYSVAENRSLDTNSVIKMTKLTMKKYKPPSTKKSSISVDYISLFIPGLYQMDNTGKFITGEMNVVLFVAFYMYIEDAYNKRNTDIDYIQRAYEKISTIITDIADIPRINDAMYSTYIHAKTVSVGIPTDGYLALRFAKENKDDRRYYYVDNEESVDVFRYDVVTQCKSILDTTFLPHIPRMGEKEEVSKLFSISQLVFAFLALESGLVGPTDVDKNVYKIYEPPGMLMMELFRKVFLAVDRDIKNSYTVRKDKNGKIIAPKFKNAMDFPHLFSTYNKAFLTSFSGSNWGIYRKGVKARTGVCQVLQRTSYNAMLSQLRKVSYNFSEKSKATKPRELNSAQYGLICPAETPDGETVGYIKHMAITAFITPDQTEEYYSLLIEESKPFMDKEGDTILMLNGTYIGRCDGLSLRDHLRDNIKRKRSKCFISIALRSEVVGNRTCSFLYIYTTHGRQCRPLIVVNNNRSSLEEIGYVDTTNNPTENEEFRNMSLDQLMTNGIIEYIDKMEEEFYNVAMDNVQLTTSHRDSGYDYMEVSPITMFGVSVNNMGYVQFNPAPRITYTAKMLDHTCGMPILGIQDRFISSLNTLWYPQKSLVNTYMYRRLGLTKNPSGSQVVVAVMSYKYNLDDAFIINKSAVDRGLFNIDSFTVVREETQAGEQILPQNVVPEFTYKYNTYAYMVQHTDENPEGKLSPSDIKSISDSGYNTTDYTTTILTKYFLRNKFTGEEIETEYLSKPDKRLLSDEYEEMSNAISATKYIFSSIARYRERTRVYKGMPLITKTFHNDVKDKVTGMKTRISESKAIKSEIRSARVDKVLLTNRKGTTLAQIRLRTYIKPQMGDKLMFPYAQKGIIGMMVSQEDMPFTQQGITPDIIFNPHSIPSRMTMGLLLELLTGKVATTANYNDYYVSLDSDIDREAAFKSTLGKFTLSSDKGRAIEQDWNDRLLLTKNKLTPINKLSNEVLDILAEHKITPDMTDTRPLSEYVDATIKGRWLEISGVRVDNLKFEDRLAFIRDAKKYAGTDTFDMKIRDSTAFKKPDMNSAKAELAKRGFVSSGYERLYDGQTGNMIESVIYTGVTYMSALRHLVEKKIHARGVGPRQETNKQPTKGKGRGGGFRTGNMEFDGLKNHNVSFITKEKLTDTADKFKMLFCNSCGEACYVNNTEGEQRFMCTKGCASDPHRVSIPYSFVTYRNYRAAMGLRTGVFTTENKQSMPLFESDISVTEEIADIELDEEDELLQEEDHPLYDMEEENYEM